MTNITHSPYTMKIKSLYIEDGNTNSSSYSYSDTSGSHSSIEVTKYVSCNP
jgi:hypothetical protein